METIKIKVARAGVYDEVAKATDYTGSKMADGDAETRDRILAGDEDLAELGRLWEESVLAVNENFKELLISGSTKQLSGIDTTIGSTTLDGGIGYEGVIEVSKSFDKALTASVETTIRSFFIASIIGQWFKFANKGEAADYLAQAAELLDVAQRLLYSRKKPTRPTN